jgi:excisionase family DNA binding protein
MNLITIDQVAELTGLSRSTLAKKRCNGSGPAFFKLGRQIKYDRSDIEAWIASRRRLSTWAANDNRSEGLANPDVNILKLFENSRGVALPRGIAPPVSALRGQSGFSEVFDTPSPLERSYLHPEHLIICKLLA